MMKHVISYLKLIRWFNLVMMAFTMLLTRHFLIFTILKLQNRSFAYADIHFVLVILSTALMAAGGYIINDIYDTQSDSTNKPEKLLVGVKISVPMAWNLYWLHSVSGVLIGLYLALQIGIYQLLAVPLMVSGLLWFYTTSYKKLPLVGNVVISLFTAFVPMVVGLFEMIAELQLFKKTYFDIWYVAAYAAFAFLISMVREVIKDMEDVEGDKQNDCNTIPVLWGIPTAKIIAAFFAVILLGFLTYLQYIQKQTNDMVSFYYFLLLVTIPLLVLIALIIGANSKQAYTWASRLSKWVMLSGICSMIVFWYTLKPYFPVKATPIPKASVQTVPEE